VIYRVPPNFPGSGRKVYPGFLQHTGFVAMNPDRHLDSHYDYFLDLVRGDDDSIEAHRQFYDEYNAVLDMPAEYYLETIRIVFQDFALVNGTWDFHGTLVRPQDITTSAVLTVEGELDDISGAGQTRAAHALCTGIPASRQFHYDVAGAGHYGIFSGRRWREKVYPEIKAFIQRFNSPDGKLGPNLQTPLAVAQARPDGYEVDRIAVDEQPGARTPTARAMAIVRRTKASSAKPAAGKVTKAKAKAKVNTITKTSRAK
jgi:poly(3-hydroxybutyrate) depolymerase